MAGKSAREISALFRETSEDSVTRHRASHLPAALAKAQAAQEVTQADDLLGQLGSLKARALAILDKAEAAGDLRTALAGVREARGCLELLAEVEGELDRRPVTNVVLTPEWVNLRFVILSALAPFPEARLAIAEALDVDE